MASKWLDNSYLLTHDFLTDECVGWGLGFFGCSILRAMTPSSVRAVRMWHGSEWKPLAKALHEVASAQRVCCC